MYRLNGKYQNLLFVVILRWARSRNRIFVMHLANMSPAIVLCGKLFWANWTSWSNYNNGSIGTDIWLIHWGVKYRFGFYFWNNFNRKVHFDQWWTLIGQRIRLNRGRIVLPLEKEACQGKFPKILDFGNLSESNDTYFERFLQLACSSTSQICPIKCQSTLNISMTHFFMLNKLWKLPWRIQNKSRCYYFATEIALHCNSLQDRDVNYSEFSWKVFGNFYIQKSHLYIATRVLFRW